MKNSNANCFIGKVYGICKDNHKKSYLYFFLISSLLYYNHSISCSAFEFFLVVYRSPSSQTGSMPSSLLSKQSGGAATKESTGVEPCDVLALAKEALSASKQAVLLAEDHRPSGANLDESHSLR